MSSTNQPQEAAGAAADPSPERIAAARAVLAGIQSRTFAADPAVPPAIGHADLIRRAVRKLFGHGR